MTTHVLDDYVGFYQRTDNTGIKENTLIGYTTVVRNMATALGNPNAQHRTNTKPKGGKDTKLSTALLSTHHKPSLPNSSTAATST